MSQLGRRLGLVFTSNAFAILIGSPVAGVLIRIGDVNVGVFAGVFVVVGAIGVGAAGWSRRWKRDER